MHLGGTGACHGHRHPPVRHGHPHAGPDSDAAPGVALASRPSLRHVT